MPAIDRSLSDCRATIEEHLSRELQVAVVPRAPSLPPNSLTGACSNILDPAVFYLWVDGSARGVGRAMATATYEFNESLGAGVDVICTGTLDIEVRA